MAEYDGDRDRLEVKADGESESDKYVMSAAINMGRPSRTCLAERLRSWGQPRHFFGTNAGIHGEIQAALEFLFTPARVKPLALDDAMPSSLICSLKRQSRLR